jgi:hypothetical protein
MQAPHPQQSLPNGAAPGQQGQPQQQPPFNLPVNLTREQVQLMVQVPFFAANECSLPGMDKDEERRRD